MNAAESRPALLGPRFDSMPAELTSRAQWLVWKAVWQPDKGKYSKVPYDAKNGGAGSSTNAATWATFEQARDAYENGNGEYAGVGFALTSTDPFVGIDLDHAIHGKEASDEARATLDRLASYAEVSPSGTGLRIFVIGELPPKGRKKGDIEAYSEARFLTITGRRFNGCPASINTRKNELTAYHAEVWPPAPPKKPVQRNSAAFDVDASDALAAAFSNPVNGAKIAALYAGDTSGYPGPSEADQALCCHLAHYSGGDAGRVNAWFCASKLWRDKWDEVHYSGGETYGEHTIQNALELHTGEFWKPYNPIEARAKHAMKSNGRSENRTASDTNGGDEQTAPATDKNAAVDAEPELFPLTDLGNAERLVHYHGAELHYNSAWGWLFWDGKRWRVDDTDAVLLKVEATIRSIPLEAAALARKAASLPADDERRDGLNKRAQTVLQWAVKSEAAQRIKACAELAQHQPGIPAAPSVFDADPFLLNVQNGILDLKTGALKPHDPAALCSKICPVDYKADAAAPLWEKCLATWQPDAEVRAFLGRAAGYSLTGDTGEETAFLLYGLGRNGKSKFTGAIEYILGDYAGRAPIEIFMQGKSSEGNGPTPDKAGLAGLRFVVASEIMQARRFNEAFVKDVTGGDSITAAHKFMKPFTFKPLLKLWFYGNHKPIVSGADDGIKARLPLVPFTVTIPAEQRDHNLDAKLRAEAEGILAWSVRGCMDWQKRRLSPPAAVVQASDEYHNEMDTLHGFFAARCIFGEGKQIWTPTADLRNALTEWAKGEGIDERSLPKANELGDRLRRHGCDDNGGLPKKIGGKAVRCWSNVRLRTDADPTGDPASNEKANQNGPKTPETPQNGEKVTPVTPGYANFGKFSKRSTLYEPTENGVTGVTGVTQEEKATGLYGTLAALRAAYRDQLEPKEPGQRLALALGRVVWVDGDTATEFWAGRPDGKPTGDVWPWEKLDEPFAVPRAVSDTTNGEDAPDDGPSLYDEYDTDPFGDEEGVDL